MWLDSRAVFCLWRSLTKNVKISKLKILQARPYRRGGPLSFLILFWFWLFWLLFRYISLALKKINPVRAWRSNAKHDVGQTLVYASCRPFFFRSPIVFDEPHSKWWSVSSSARSFNPFSPHVLTNGFHVLSVIKFIFVSSLDWPFNASFCEQDRDSLIYLAKLAEQVRNQAFITFNSCCRHARREWI